MSDLKLTSPRIAVQFFNGREPLEIQSANPDLVLWDMTRVKHKWPKFDEAPFLWLTFVAWAAARRSGAIPTDMTWDAWREEVADAEALDVGTDGEEGRPTDAGPAPA
jgi:hypothetical protein